MSFKVELTKAQIEALIPHADEATRAQFQAVLLEDFPEWISETERQIIGRILNRALTRGYEITVNDGEAVTISRSTDLGALRTAIGHTEETYLHIYIEGRPCGWIWLVHGNEEDVVTDLTDTPLLHELID